MYLAAISSYDSRVTHFMDQLPCEISQQIYSKCDLATLLNIRKTSRKQNEFVRYTLSKRRKLDIRTDYFVNKEKSDNSENEDFRLLAVERVCSFLEFHLPALTTLVLADIPLRITLATLIRLASACPSVSNLEIVQENGWPHTDRDSLYALPYFKRLKRLRLHGWKTKDVNRRGCAHLAESIPVQKLQQLEELSIYCEEDTVPKMLTNFRQSRLSLRRLKHIELGLRYSHTGLPALILSFLTQHPRLEEIRFKGLLFSTEAQVTAFYSALSSLRFLRRVILEECTTVDALSPSTLHIFRNDLSRRNGVLQGEVTSHRFVA